MTESLPGGPRVLSHADLDRSVRSLFVVGGIYELVAGYVERDNRRHCTGTPTSPVTCARLTHERGNRGR